MKARSKDFYDQFANVVKQHVESCFTNIKIKTVGSRNRGDFKRTSDYDYQFCIPGDPTKENIYPRLKECIITKLPDFRGEIVRVELGGSGNVVNVYPGVGGKVSFALEPCSKFL